MNHETNFHPFYQGASMLFYLNAATKNQTLLDISRLKFR